MDRHQARLAEFASDNNQDAFGQIHVMDFQVQRARHYYAGARPLSSLLSPAGRAVFQVMAGTYESLLNAIEKSDYDVFRKRIGLSRWRKLGLVMQAMPARLGWV